MLKVSNMEDRHAEFDVRIMPHTIDVIQTAGLAKGILLRCTLQTEPCSQVSTWATQRKRWTGHTSRLSSTPSLTGTLSVAV